MTFSTIFCIYQKKLLQATILQILSTLSLEIQYFWGLEKFLQLHEM